MPERNVDIDCGEGRRICRMNELAAQLVEAERRLAALQEECDWEIEKVERHFDARFANLRGEAEQLRQRLEEYVPPLAVGQELQVGDIRILRRTSTKLQPQTGLCWADVVHRLKAADKSEALSTFERPNVRTLAEWGDDALSRYGMMRTDSHALAVVCAGKPSQPLQCASRGAVQGA